MFKRLFWVSIGVGIGVVAVTKAQAYVKANTPDTARQFLLGPDQDHVTMRTLEGLVNEFNATRRAREAELNSKYAARNEKSFSARQIRSSNQSHVWKTSNLQQQRSSNPHAHF